MDIRNTRGWLTLAGERLDVAPCQKKIVGIYAGITVGLAVLMTLINYCLELSMAKATGLSGMGSRTLLSTLQTMLPMVQTVLLMCLELGYVAAMLRIARGQYVSANTLRLGFDRFWVLLRSRLLRGAVYLAVCLPVMYLAVAVFMMTPFADPLVEALLPLMTQSQLVMEDAVMEQMLSAMEPCIVFCGVFMGLAYLVVSYRFRMVDYILIDHPGIRARNALGESRRMMKGNCWRLFRLDVKLWWYHGALLLATLVSYLDVILPRLGVELPWSQEVTGWVAFGGYLAVLLSVYLLLRNRAEVVCGFAYDAIKPRQEHTEGVVLGNIFQM